MYFDDQAKGNVRERDSLVKMEMEMEGKKGGNANDMNEARYTGRLTDQKRQENENYIFIF